LRHELLEEAQVIGWNFRLWAYARAVGADDELSGGSPVHCLTRLMLRRPLVFAVPVRIGLNLQENKILAVFLAVFCPIVVRSYQC
jgi:hypothetical protein